MHTEVARNKMSKKSAEEISECPKDYTQSITSLFFPKKGKKKTKETKI